MMISWKRFTQRTGHPSSNARAVVKQETLLPPTYCGPSPEALLANDGLTRLLILAVLHNAEVVSLKFITTLVQGSTAERRRSLMWLETHGCIRKLGKRCRVYFWKPWQATLSYTPTPRGETLYRLVMEAFPIRTHLWNADCSCLLHQQRQQ